MRWLGALDSTPLPIDCLPPQDPEGPSCLPLRLIGAIMGNRAAMKTLMELMKGRRGTTSLLISRLTVPAAHGFHFNELSATNQRDNLARPSHCSEGGAEWEPQILGEVSDVIR